MGKINAKEKEEEIKDLQINGYSIEMDHFAILYNNNAYAYSFNDSEELLKEVETTRLYSLGAGPCVIIYVYANNFKIQAMGHIAADYYLHVVIGLMHDAMAALLNVDEDELDTHFFFYGGVPDTIEDFTKHAIQPPGKKSFIDSKVRVVNKESPDESEASCICVYMREKGLRIIQTTEIKEMPDIDGTFFDNYDELCAKKNFDYEIIEFPVLPFSTPQTEENDVKRPNPNIIWESPPIAKQPKLDTGEVTEGSFTPR